MNREHISSSLKLFAFLFRDGDAGLLFFLETFIDKRFLAAVNSEAEKNNFLLFFRDFHRGRNEAENPDFETLLKEVCEDVNKNHLLKSRLILVVYLLECAKLLSPQKVSEIGRIADALYLKNELYSYLHDFAFSSNPYDDHPDTIMVIDGLEVKVGDYIHLPKPGLVGEILILKLPGFNFMFGRSFYPHPIFVGMKKVVNDEIFIFEQGETIRQAAITIFYKEVALDFIEETIDHKYSLAAENVGLAFNDARVLREINLCEESGTLVGIMGASGAGKTTLLNVLTGMEKPTEGEVRINGMNLHENPLHFEGVIGYISQDDILFEELSVYQNLYYNAQLIFKGVSNEVIDKTVLKTLENLGLLGIKDIKVGNPLNKKISGGQRKRLNIALELLREPSILFVDEPTSGLSSRDSEMVMDLLKELSRKGKLVFVVIHQPSSDIYKLFDKIVILDTGGYQVFYGTPLQAPVFFRQAANYINSESGTCEACENINPEIIFNILDEKKINAEGDFTNERKVAPVSWNEHYQKLIPLSFQNEIKEQNTKSYELPGRLSQWFIFLKRDFFSRMGNFQYLFINLLEAPALAAILAFIVRYTAKFNTDQYIFRENENLPAYLFMSVIVMLFLGMSVSAEEIFRDQKILKREKFLHLSRLSYLLSKAALLFAISSMQAALFASVGNYIMGIKGMFLPYFLVLFSVGCASNIIGLIISSSFNSVVTIYIMIPILIIPQMILGGAMFSYDKLNKAIGGGAKVPVTADFMVSRWAFEGLSVNQFIYNNFEKRFYSSDKRASALNYKMVYALPQLSQVAQDARSLISADNDSLKELLDDKLSLLRGEIKKELKADSTLSFKNLNRLYRGLYTKYVANATVDFFDALVKSYTQKFLVADKSKNDTISALLETAEDEKKFLRIKDQYANDYLGDVVKRSMAKNKTLVENGELKQLVDAIYLDPEPSFLSIDTHFFAPQKYLFGKPVKTIYFNVLFIWFMTFISFLVLYFDLVRKLFRLFVIRY
jgi:ABC transport system ATP-binding/permease protein